MEMGIKNCKALKAATATHDHFFNRNEAARSADGNVNEPEQILVPTHGIIALNFLAALQQWTSKKTKCSPVFRVCLWETGLFHYLA